MADTISFARGAPSLDIVDVEGLREAAQLAFEADPAGTTAYGTSVGYVPLREWIAAQHGVEVDDVLARRRRQGRVRVLVLQDRLPRDPRRLPRRRAGDDQADPGDRHQYVHLAEHGRPVDRQPVLPHRPDGRG